MNFTDEHIETLEKHRHLWETFKAIEVIPNLDKDVVDELQEVYNDVIGPQQFGAWCPSCVIDLVRNLYLNYDKWIEQNGPVQEEATPDVQPATDEVDNLGDETNVGDEVQQFDDSEQLPSEPATQNSNSSRNKRRSNGN